MENPVLTVELSGHLARATTVGRRGVETWEVASQFTFYVDNVETDKLNISLKRAPGGVSRAKRLGAEANRCLQVILDHI